MNMEMNHYIKFSYKNTIKRIICPATLDRFKKNISVSLGLAKYKANNLRFYYCDEEGDEIDISNEFDYEQTLIFLEQEGYKYLKVFIQDVEQKNEEEMKTSKPKITGKDCVRGECTYCGRCFFLNRLEYHERVCQKVHFKVVSKENQKKESKDVGYKAINTSSGINDEEFVKNNSIRNWKQEVENYPLPGFDCNEPERIPCEFCKRKFVKESLEKHEKVCQKVFLSNVNKVEDKFDMVNDKPKPESKWKEKHNELITAIDKIRKKKENKLEEESYEKIEN